MTRFTTPVLLLVLAAAFLLSLAAGKVWIAPNQFWGSGLQGLILFELRLPRALLGLLVGASLGGAGAVLQGYLRNPLAEPGVIGVSATAALGAVAAIFLGATAAGPVVALSGMAAAMLAVAVLALIAGGSPLQLILAGVVLSSLSAALTALLISLAPNPFALGEIVTWLMGALTDRALADAALLLPATLVSLWLLAGVGRALDALTLGEPVATSLGVDPRNTRLKVVVGVGLGVGAAVAVTGVISFVGLVVPHLLRPLVGQQPGRLLLPSALGGAILVLVADSLVRLVPGAAELKLGIAMALIGAPFFLWLLWREGRRLA
jgi:iron complex transport system permease protein